MPPFNSDRFQFGQCIGSGSFGHAYLAVDHTTGNEVVIKRQEAGGIRCYAEIEHSLLETLRHRHIVRYLGGWCTGNQLFLVMDYCNGGSLRDKIRARREPRRPFREFDIRQYICQISSALRYCHLQHVLHRDLKPENVLLHDGHVKLADFGLARSISSTTSFATSRVGTPGAFAPEVTDTCIYNYRADMWGLGVVLFNLLTLSRPFVGHTVSEVLRSVAYDNPDPRALSGNIYSAELYDLCDQLLDKDPTKRPSAWEVLALPWLAAETMEDEQRQKERELEAWGKIMIDATHPSSIVREIVSLSVQVNIRATPSRDGAILRTVGTGDTIEELQEVCPPGGTQEVWLKLTDGYCIRHHPDPRKVLFRRVPQWRIRRPGDSPSSLPPATSVCATLDEGGEQRSTALLLKSFTTPTERVAALLNYLSAEGLTEELLSQLVSAHDALATDLDDSAWTSFAIAALRPHKIAYCVRVLRLAVHLMDVEDRRGLELLVRDGRWDDGESPCTGEDGAVCGQP